MKNEPKPEKEIEALARIVKTGFDRMDAGFEEVNQRVDALDNRVADVERGLKGLSCKVDQPDQKLDQNREE